MLDAPPRPAPLPPASRSARRPAVTAVALWSTRHRALALAGWLLFVVLCLVGGSAAGTHSIDEADSGAGASKQADARLGHADFGVPPTERILIQARSGRAGVEADAAVAQLRTKLGALAQVRAVGTPVHSADGRSLLLPLTLEVRTDLPDSEATRAEKLAVAPTLAVTAVVASSHQDLVVEQVGDASLSGAIDKSYSDDFARAEVTSVPVTLLVLLVAFGALIAAAVPVLLALTAVASAMGLASLASHLLPMSDSQSSVVLLIGMAVGVDYSLFYLRREREERRRGAGARDAVELAAATAGHAVLVSGLTVMVAMAGMFLAGNAIFSSMALGTILVVAVAVLGSLTVLPAVLASLGERMDRPRVPLLWRLTERAGRAQLTRRILAGLLSRPALALVVAGGALVALALPAAAMRTGLPGTDSLPASIPAVAAHHDVTAAFPDTGASHTLALWSTSPAPLPAEAVNSAVAALDREAGADPRFAVSGRPAAEFSRDGRVARVALPIVAADQTPDAKATLTALRSRLVPATIGPLRGLAWGVTGDTAGSTDFGAQQNARLPLVIGFVLALTFVVLLGAFRSVPVALVTLGLNLLSVGAAYGLLALVFQHTWAEGLLGFTSTGSVVAWLPLFLFVVLFGLSLDYHVLVVSRIREGVLAGVPARTAVREGIEATAGTVTSAAAVMVGVFGIFATLGAIDFKQMGVGLASAIALDATLVRTVLLPASLTLLGERAWHRT